MIEGPHFELQHTREDGSIITRDPICCATDTGVILNSHPKADPQHIRHMCALARTSPHAPFDLTAFGANEKLIWSARLFWRD